VLDPEGKGEIGAKDLRKMFAEQVRFLIIHSNLMSSLHFFKGEPFTPEEMEEMFNAVALAPGAKAVDYKKYIHLLTVDEDLLFGGSSGAIKGNDQNGI